MIRQSTLPPLRAVVADAPSAPLLGADGVTFRRVASLAEYHECVAIQEETWGVGFRELVPAAVLMVAQKLGGVCAAAFAAPGPDRPEPRMLGFVFGLTGIRDGALVHWSDLLAVRPEARGAHVGERLKRYQRELVLGVGVRTMYWTFDPLVARNAHLNLARLGARAAEYVPNMYGENTGSPLHGQLATDRFVAAWDLVSTDGHPPVVPAEPPGVLVTPIGADALPLPVHAAALPDAPVVHVAVPRDLETLPNADRIAWRAATREAFLHYLARGYHVATFDRGSDTTLPHYVLTVGA
jgi:predicted GNAT superfamily acetyltransferase